MPYLIFLVTLFLSLHASPNEPTLTKIITPSSEVAGFDVDIDGEYSAIGSTGKVYIYKYDGVSGWTQFSTISPTVDSQFFGMEVALEGNILVTSDHWFGSDSRGKVYVYELQAGDTWELVYTLEGESDGWNDLELGYSVEINNGVIVAGSNPYSGYSGEVYIIKKTGNDGSSSAYEYKKYTLPNTFSIEERHAFGQRLSLVGNTLAVTSSPVLQDDVQTHLGSCFIINIDNTDELHQITTTDPEVNGFCGNLALTKDFLITTSLDWFNINDNIKLFSYKKLSSGAWSIVDEFILPCDNDCGVIDLAVSNNILAITRFGITRFEDDAIIDESYIQLFSVDNSGEIEYLSSIPQKLSSNENNDYFGYSISHDGINYLVGAPASTNDMVSDNPQGAFYYFKIPMVGFSVTAMGGIGLLALGLSMLGLGAVRMRK